MHDPAVKAESINVACCGISNMAPKRLRSQRMLMIAVTPTSKNHSAARYWFCIGKLPIGVVSNGWLEHKSSTDHVRWSVAP